MLPERPVLVAPDSFKGTFRASEVAGAIGRGLERAGLMPPDLCPVADGGEGTLDALLPGLGGELVAAPAHAPKVFGPQKGADPDTVARLERRFDRLAARWPRDPRGVPLTGCAGGLSGGLWAVHGALLEPGAPWVLDALGFDARM